MVEIDTEEEDEDPRENLPEGTKHVFAGTDNYAALPSALPDGFFEGQGLDPQEVREKARNSLGGEHRVTFDKGDEIPLDTIARSWEHVGDVMIATDGNQQVISSKGTKGLDKDNRNDVQFVPGSWKQKH